MALPDDFKLATEAGRFSLHVSRGLGLDLSLECEQGCRSAVCSSSSLILESSQRLSRRREPWQSLSLRQGIKPLPLQMIPLPRMIGGAFLNWSEKPPLQRAEGAPGQGQ
jgi:hypothetical protein